MNQFAYLPSPQPLALDTLLRPVVIDGPAENSTVYFAALSLGHQAVGSPTPQVPVLAQQFDQDILGDMVSMWNTFIESGQVWALIIGLVIGYLLRGITAY